MTKDESPESIWDRHWRSREVPAKALLASQTVTTGYDTLRGMVTESDTSLLEAGCGTGAHCYMLARDFPHATVTGLDYSETAVSRAREIFNLPNLHFVQGDLFDLPYDDGAWDVVFNEGVIEHFRPDGERSYMAALHEMVRVTRPGGKVIVSVPNFYCLPHTVYKALMGPRFEYGYEKSFRPYELRAAFEAAGLRVTSWRGCNFAVGIGSWRRIVSVVGYAAGACERFYTAARPYLGWAMDPFGHMVFMCGTKVQHEAETARA